MVPVMFLLIAVSEHQLIAAEPSHARRTAAEEMFESAVVPIVEEYCVECHEGDAAEGEVPLDGLRSVEQILENREKWERVYRQLGIDGMPPEDHDPRLSQGERKSLLEWLDQKLHHVDCNLVDDAGRVTIHRLNRTEYDNTIRDLLGVDIQPAADFPSDDLGYGFSNNGDVLSLPPLLLEKYVNAAERIAAETIVTEPLNQRKTRFADDQLKATGNAKDRIAGFRVMNSTGSVFCERDIDLAGEYVVRVEAAAEQAGPELAKMEIRVDGKAVKVHEIQGHREPATYEIRQHLAQGRRRIEAAFVNDYYNPDAESENDRDRNLGVSYIEIQGPMDITGPKVHRRVVFTGPTAEKSEARAASEIFTQLMPQAFRRPVDVVEVERIVRLVEFAISRGESFERGIQIGLQAILVSPYFLFRVEYDTEPDNAQDQHDLSDYELASRLSYFLWSTMPDDELFRLAKAGRLHEPQVLDQQVARMLEDPKSDTLVENFASQWLTLGNLAEVQPDPKLFPRIHAGVACGHDPGDSVVRAHRLPRGPQFN